MYSLIGGRRMACKGNAEEKNKTVYLRASEVTVVVRRKKRKGAGEGHWFQADCMARLSNTLYWTLEGVWCFQEQPSRLDRGILRGKDYVACPLEETTVGG